MVVQAAVDGIGVALGHSLMIARELEQGTLVTLFDSPVAAPAPYLLVTAPASRRKPEVAAFRDWILAQASLNTLNLPKGGSVAPVVLESNPPPPSIGLVIVGGTNNYPLRAAWPSTNRLHRRIG